MKKRFNLALMIAGIVCLAIVLVGCALTVNQVKKDPTANVYKAIENTVNSFDTDIPFTMPKGLDKEGTVDMKINGIPDFEDGIAMNYAYKTDDNAMNLSVSTGVIGDFEIYSKDGECAVSNEMLLGENVIGFDAKTLKEDLKDSVLLELLGISYDELTEQLDDSIFEVKDYAEARANFEKAIKDVLVNCETEVAEQTVTTNGEDAKAICVTYNMDEDAIVAVFDAYEELLGNVNSSVSNDYSMYFDNLSKAVAAADMGGKLTFAINPDKKVIMQASMDVTGTVDGEEDSASIVFDLGKVPANSDKFSVEFKSTEETASIIYDRTEKDGKFCRNISIKADNDELSFEFVYDKANAEFTVTSSESDGDVISGTIKSSENEMSITLDKMGIPDTEDLTVSLTVKNTADVKDVPEYKKITDMTAEELQTVITSFSGMLPDNNPYYDDSDTKYYEFDSTYDYNFDGVVNDGDKAYFDKYYGENSDASYIYEFDPAFDYDFDGDLDDDDKEFFDAYYSNLGDIGDIDASM